jgi:hypothetical protein
MVNGSQNFDSTGAVTGSLAIIGVAVSSVGPTSAVVSWTTDGDGDGLVRYGTTTNALSFSATNPVTGTDHTVPLVNLTPSTQYFFEVESTDGEGDTAVDDNAGSFHTFTTAEADLQRKAFVGTVVGEPGETVTLRQNGNKGDVIIILPDEYELRTPGGPRASTFGDGAEVVILSQKAGDQWVALWVLVKPVKPILPVVGVVTEVGPTSLTVLDRKGNAHLLRLENPLDSSIEGEAVTLFPGNGGQLRGLVRAEDVRQRLSKFLEQAEEEEGEEASEADDNLRRRLAKALLERLQKQGAAEVDLLDRALQHAPAGAKTKIEAARAKAQKEFESSQKGVYGSRGMSKPGNSSEDDGDVSEPDLAAEASDKPAGGTSSRGTNQGSGSQGKAGVQGNGKGHEGGRPEEGE